MKRSFSVTWSMALAVLFGGISSASAASVPQLLTQQGRLFDASNQPVTGPLGVVFSIYDSPSATTPLWTESQTITCDDGYFSATLGGTTSLSAVLDGSVRYFGMKVGTDLEMTPRTPIQSVPYALVAGDAVGAIHPTSVSIGGTMVIDSSGKWVGDKTGMGGGGIVSTTGVAATVGTLSGTSGWVFAGTPASVTLQPGQRITATITAVLGQASTGTGAQILVGLCYQPSGGSLILLGNYVTAYVTPTRNTFTASYSQAPSLSGATAASVGMCVWYTSGTPLSNNGESMGWVQITN